MTRPTFTAKRADNVARCERIQLAPLADESIPEDGNRLWDQTGAPVTPARHVADTGNTPGLETGAPQLRDAQELVGFRQPIERLSELLLI